MLRVLGRGTSGNVQKVVWLLEELGTPYKREDYGRQFNNTQDAAYLTLNPNGKVPTLVDGEDGGLGIEHDPALSREQAGRHQALSGRAARRAARSSAGWIGSWPR